MQEKSLYFPPRNWQLFAAGADIGVRGTGETLEQAFEAAGFALFSMVTEPELVVPKEEIRFRCMGTDQDALFENWLNHLIFEMSTRRMLFSRFEIKLDDYQLRARLWGEALEKERHLPALQPKLASLTELKVQKTEEGQWIAQCVIHT